MPNATTTGVVPGYTDLITTVRPVAAAAIEQTTTGPGNFYNRMRRADLGVEQVFGRLQLDYNALYTQTHINGGGGGRGGILINRLTGAGWILDRTQSDLFPRFLPNGGPDFSNPNNYRPTTYTNSILVNNNHNKEVRGNARCELPVSFPLFVKAGALWREQYVGAESVSHRWNYAGTAVVQGWEFTYQQQFTFLPGLLKGLGASANYTLIATHGNFGGTTERSTNEVLGFIPRTGNASLSWRHRKFSTRVLYNFVGRYLNNYSASTPARNQYRYKYQTVTAGVAFQFRPTLQFTIDVANLLNEPQRLYRSIPSQMSNTVLNGTTITFGVNGRF